MFKKLLLALVITTPAMMVNNAEALPSARTLTVKMEGRTVGTWKSRNSVSDDGDVCRYTIAWKNTSQSRTVTCGITEEKAGDDLDCEDMRTRWFDTFVTKTSGISCRGFDPFGRESRITRLVAGEGTSGLSGVVTVESVGDVVNLRVQ